MLKSNGKVEMNKGFRWRHLWVVLALVACGGALGSHNDGGESHFLRHCQDSCTEGLQCISGICTRPCRVDQDVCSDLSPRAMCTNASVEPGSIAVCDVGCQRTADCAALGGRFDCVAGFCREELEAPAGNGGSAGEAASGAGGGGEGASDAGGSGGGAGVAGGSDGGSPGSCEGFDDEPALPLRVRITNGTDGTIHVAAPLGTCATPDVFDVTDTLGNKSGESTMCRETCQSLIERPLQSCEPLCHTDTAVTLEAGASIERSWTGVFGRKASLPAGCSKLYSNGIDCRIQTHYRQGTHVFTALAGAALECAQDGVSCEPCSPDASGTCVSERVQIGGDILTATFEVMLDPSDPADERIELVFRSP